MSNWKYIDRRAFRKILIEDVLGFADVNFQGWFTPDITYTPPEPDGTEPAVYAVIDVVPVQITPTSGKPFELPTRKAELWVTVVSSTAKEWIFETIFNRVQSEIYEAYNEERINLWAHPSDFRPPSAADSEGDIPAGFSARVGIYPYRDCGDIFIADGTGDPVTDGTGDPISH
jgi:hypothetical protein